MSLRANHPESLLRLGRHMSSARVRPRIRTHFVLLAIAMLLSVAEEAWACTPPAFAIEHDFTGVKGEYRGVGVAYVSLRPTDLSIAQLRCLARRLRTKHPWWRSVAVHIFDSREAARGYIYRPC